MRWFLCLLMISSAHGAVFPDQGHSFEVREESFLEMIQKRMTASRLAGKTANWQEEVRDKIKHQVMYPHPIEGISKAEGTRQYDYDPSITVDEDIIDHKSRMIHKKGTRLNPLDYVSWGEPLLIIDGTDPKQLDWALSQKAKIVLMKGSPIELSRLHNRRFYFDQGGLIIKKFSLQAVPAKISQKGNKLLIEEVVV